MDFVDDPQAAAASIEIVGDQTLSPVLRLYERLGELPQVAIGKIVGLARGAGAFRFWDRCWQMMRQARRC
jgi:hypothetical protein